MDMTEHNDEQVPIDVDVVSVFSYQDQVIITFLDGTGEHGAIMETAQAKAFSDSILNAVEMANKHELEERYVN